MSKRPDPKALARAIREGRQDFDAALEWHLNDNCQAALDCESAQVILCYAVMGRWDEPFDLDDREMTVAEIIEEFRLRPFVKLFEGEGQDEIALDDLVEAMGETYRVIGIRQVTPFAMPRCDEWEVMLETLDGEPLHLAGLSEVTKLSERDASA